MQKASGTHSIPSLVPLNFLETLPALSSGNCRPVIKFLQNLSEALAQTSPDGGPGGPVLPCRVDADKQAALCHRALGARLGPRPLLPGVSPLHSSASSRGDVGHKDFFGDPFCPLPSGPAVLQVESAQRAENSPIQRPREEAARVVKGEAYPALSLSLPLSPKSVSSWESGSGGITEETRVWLAGRPGPGPA